jgi:hypothetical protein
MLASAPAGSRVNNAPCRVVDRVNKLVQLLFLVLRQRTGLLVAAREIDIHVGGHFEYLIAARDKLVCSCSGFGERGCGGVGGGDAIGKEARRKREGGATCNAVFVRRWRYSELVEREKGFKRARTTNSCLQ